MLPLALIMRVRLEKLEKNLCVVSIPYYFINKNPFGSIYFAGLNAAAELSTGILIRNYFRKHEVSILVKNMQAEFFKKATNRIYFTCSTNLDLINTKDQIQTLILHSEGKDSKSNLACSMTFYWSIKLL